MEVSGFNANAHKVLAEVLTRRAKFWWYIDGKHRVSNCIW